MNNRLAPLDDIRSVIAKRRRKALENNETKRIVGSLFRTLLILFAFILIFNIWFSFRIVDGNVMYPALSDGDLTLTFKKSSYVKNDVVFYEVNGETHVGRVVAKSGDIVDITEDGNLLVNGTVQTGEILFKTYPPNDFSGALTVEKNSVYILGDNRTDTTDSRKFGCISLDKIKGKIITLIRHRGI